MLKRTFMAFILLLLFAGTAFAANVNVNLTIGQNVAWVGGQVTNLPIAPFETKGITYVPVRFVGEAMGARIDWNGQTRSVSFTNGERKVTLYVGNKKIYINGALKYTDAVPQIKDNYVMVPIRLISEAFGAQVEYNPLGRVITIKTTEPPIAQFDIYPYTVIAGEQVTYTEYSYDPDGDAIVNWEWDGKQDVFYTPGTYTVRLRVQDVNGRWSTWAVKTITVNEIPNDPPRAYFTSSRTTVAQGETVTYYDASSDPDGDSIIDYQWTGNKRAFFKPGSFNVTLKVKDARGKWSEPYTVTINVTDEVVMNEFQYNLANPSAGEIFPLMGIGDADFTTLQPTLNNEDNVTLFYSNSPEKVTGNGILYADTLSGRIRLMYHHRNVSDKKKRFYLIAQNTTDREISLKYIKGGYAGPSTDDFRVGQMGIMRYLQSYYDRDVIIPPGKWMTINIGSNELVGTNTGESIYGLYEIETSDSLKFMAIALDDGKNLENSLPYLYPLQRDVHSRGTFANANRNMTVYADKNTRFSIGDGVRDLFLTGYDAITNQVTVDKGNYGVMYNINIIPERPLIVIANPRGGGFGGTFALNGNYFYAPKSGGFAFNTTSMATMLGTINSDTKMIFTPPASSNLPIYINFLKN